MKELVWVYYAGIIVATVGFLAIFAEEPRRPTAMECGVAEISPDMSPQDRAVCRQLRQHRHRM
jgi:hypothetical protein